MVDESCAMRERGALVSSNTGFAIVFMDWNIFLITFLFGCILRSFKIPRGKALAWSLAFEETKKGLLLFFLGRGL